MGKALKTFLVLNLILSAVVVGLGVKVFLDREVIKARTLLLQEYAAKTADNLKWGTAVDWETSDERKQNPFNIPQPIVPDELPALEGSLGDLARFATQRQAQLTQRYEELVQTKQELADTTDRLNTRTRELADARTQISNLEGTLAKTQNDLRDANRQVDTLRSEKTSLERQVDDLNREIQEKNDTIATLEVDLETTREVLTRAESKLAACEGRNSETPGVSRVWKGRTAKILTVNDKWNYVVINKGNQDDLEMFLEAYVHRGDTYIGRLTVVRIEDMVAIAEIQAGTLADGATIEAGDTIFF